MDYYIEITDKRNKCLYEHMRAEGEAVWELLSLDAPAKEGSAFIFSPARRLSLEVLEGLPKGITLYASFLPKGGEEIISKKGIRNISYQDSEEFALKNAALTAEGVLSLVIERTETSIYENKILLLGGGRCGKSIAKLFARLQLDFTLLTRGEGMDRMRAELEEGLGSYDVIINTVPSVIIDKKLVGLIKSKALYLEIASLCSVEGEGEFSYYKAGGLPQIYSPLSAAKLMYQLIKEEK